VTRSRDEEELREYLGAAYDHARLVRWQEQLEEEAAGVDEATLYRTSEAYLYNLTAFAMTGTKAPYLDVVRALVPPGGSILDFGCGIGSDGLVLLEEGYRVAFADFDNPSVAYLRWRLERRGLAADVLDLDAGALPGGFDLAFAFDVLEHASSWEDVLARMEACAALVCVNALETSPQETVLHRELPVRSVVAHARRRGLRSYTRWHAGRSHLLVYASGGGVHPLVSAWRAVRGGRPRGPRRGARPASSAGGGGGRGG
jgi:SAM-dependent methyltransferase